MNLTRHLILFLKDEKDDLVRLDKNLIDISLMTNEEKDWLNEYHLKCRKKIRENLEENEKIWLDHATKKIE